MAVVILVSPKIWASQRRQGVAINQRLMLWPSDRGLFRSQCESSRSWSHLLEGPSCLDASRGGAAQSDPVEAKNGARPGQHLAVSPPTPFCPYCRLVDGIAGITLIRRMTGSIIL